MEAYLLENIIFFLKTCSLIFFSACMLFTLGLFISAVIRYYMDHKDN